MSDVKLTRKYDNSLAIQQGREAIGDRKMGEKIDPKHMTPKEYYNFKLKVWDGIETREHKQNFTAWKWDDDEIIGVKVVRQTDIEALQARIDGLEKLTADIPNRRSKMKERRIQNVEDLAEERRKTKNQRRRANALGITMNKAEYTKSVEMQSRFIKGHIRMVAGYLLILSIWVTATLWFQIQH